MKRGLGGQNRKGRRKGIEKTKDVRKIDMETYHFRSFLKKMSVCVCEMCLNGATFYKGTMLLTEIILNKMSSIGH